MILNLTELRQQLEQLIHATPSGEARNAMTDANISLMQAEDLQNMHPLDLRFTRACLQQHEQQVYPKTLQAFTRRACDALKKANES